MRVLLVHRGPQPELVRLLAREGHDVLVVAETERPIRFLGVFKPDLVLVAMHEPVAACRLVRQAAPGVPLLAVIPSQDVDSRIAALEAGADDCLGAPFHWVELDARMLAVQRRKGFMVHASAPAELRPLDATP
jgi:DNA-binding response OmpR family regulator